MRLQILRRAVLAGALLAGALLIGIAPAAAQASTLTFGLDIEFSGGDTPAGTAPWLTAVIDDLTGNDNSVRLTMSAFGLVSQESVGEWLFNFDPALDPTLLTFTAIDETALNGEVAEFFAETDGFMADGDGQFDIQFILPPPQGNFDDRFTTGEQLIYELLYPTAISAGSFFFDSTMGGGAGAFQSAAQVQSIGPGPATGSGWVGDQEGVLVAVPEPSTSLLLGVGVVGLASALRRRKNR